MDHLFNLLTLVVSVAALVFSVFSWRVAVHANRAAIFDRRFEIYKDVEEFIRLWARDARPDMNKLGMLVDAWNRSHFLFDRNVTQYLRKLWVDAVQANRYRDIVAGEAAGDRQEAISKGWALTREHTDSERLRAAFLPYLKVSDGYLSFPKWPRCILHEFMYPKRPWLATAPANDEPMPPRNKPDASRRA